MLRVLALVSLFFLGQIGGLALVCAVEAMQTGVPVWSLVGHLSPASVAQALAVGQVLLLALLWALRARLPLYGLRANASWRPYGWAVLLLILAMIPANLLTEALALPDYNEALMRDILGSSWGLVSVLILAPVAEEWLFRGGVWHVLFAGGEHPWRAVVGSAALFALVHGNPAQMPGAFLLGMLFGWLTLRARSLWPAVLAHVANNALGVLAICCLPTEASLAETLGGPWAACAISTCCLFLLGGFLWAFHRKPALFSRA